jgi:predicted nucleic acid-binding protein
MTLVLDASAAISLVMGLPDGHAIRGTLQAEREITAPPIYVSEVANALWKYVRAGTTPLEGALEQLADAQEIIDRYVSLDADMPEILRAAARVNHPIYDLLYLTLAKRLNADLVTLDRRLRALATTEGIRVAP